MARQDMTDLLSFATVAKEGSFTRAAKRLGMTTVWVSADSHQPPYVDATVRSACDLPRLMPLACGRL